LTECIGFTQNEVVSAKVVPELQHWFYGFVIQSTVNKYVVPAPVNIDAHWMSVGSFIEMLFNEDYAPTFYEYRYKGGTSNAGWPEVVRTRAMIYGAAADYLQLDPTGDNVFLLQQDDFTLLDALLAYRQDSTGVTIIDTTAVTVVVFDSTSGTLVVNYSTLSTDLSKLIYLYLKLKIYGDYSQYDNLTVISGENLVLNNMFELVLIDEYFNTVSNRYVRNVGGCT
jgi:hypothetical protein